MGTSGRRSLTRRSVVRGMGLAGASALSGALPVSKAFAQAKAPMQLSFWTYENPETRPWLLKRIKDGDKFVRQGFKFAMHTAQWTMIQFNPILIQCGGAWFDASGKCTVNSPAGVKAMTLRLDRQAMWRGRPGGRDLDQSDPADGLAKGALLDVLGAATDPADHCLGKSHDEVGRVFPSRAVSRRHRRKGISDHLRLQPRHQCAGLQGEAGGAARPLSVHLRRSHRLLGGDRAVHAGAQKRLARSPDGAHFPMSTRSSRRPTTASSCRAPWCSTNSPTPCTGRCRRSCSTTPTSKWHSTMPPPRSIGRPPATKVERKWSFRRRRPAC